ncbi:MAG: RagB/SusD family nutrient uptake outer membrane protein [Lentimicrobium sp.]|uniref:RagB/SusD family nutrient uptake outer membrane protein n=1 Tax=Lentimicrobium sp. TaxID=2034841 RepID=UPI0025DFF6EF|nr:RagB/SusD family nutrient uptake outer membrane protein [Lentimicrobium sp.]MCO5256334.1 RagB/SusD family nutrient uptake outer membrane protein [Lentimicrobium sp.]
MYRLPGIPSGRCLPDVCRSSEAWWWRKRNAALELVNQLRTRAYGAADGNITGGELTLDFILDERARELYWEGHRRTDLIRYDKFTTSAYLWPWKGKVPNGTATGSFRNLYPIPAAEMSANPNLQQNTGY